MLQSILISPDIALNGELTAALKVCGDVEVSRALTSYPTADEFLRTVRARKPQFLFLCVDDFPKAQALAAQIDDFLPGFYIVGLSRHVEPEMLPKLMHLGLREFLTTPLDAAKLAGVVASVQRYLRSHPPKVFRLADLYTFLPAKAGVGCSTIAVSTSCALADELGARTLLMDCDLAAGAIKFLLKLGNSASFVDAMCLAGSLDEELWTQFIGRWDELDVLHAGDLNPPSAIDLDSLQRVLSVARSQYEVICVDLASRLDPFSLDLIRESRRVFVVTTPELVPLHLAGKRIAALQELGLGDRVSLLLNRKGGKWRELPDDEVVQSVGMPVAFSFSNDYRSVEKSIVAGSPVAQTSKLGQGILNLARTLAPHLEAKSTPKHHKFLEFFSVSRDEEFESMWRS